MKKMTIALLCLVVLPGFAQDRTPVESRGQQLSEFTRKITARITAGCSQKVLECSQKVQALAEQNRDFAKQAKTCQELGQQVGSCISRQMNAFGDDANKLDLHDANFDRSFSEFVKKWDN